MGIPHVLAIPYPAQGHVIPMVGLVQKIVHQGFKVTFVNSDFNHNRVMNARPKNVNDDVENQINMVSIPDGLEAWEDRNDLAKLTQAIFRVMPGKLEELIQNINDADDNKISSVIADGSMGWALRVAEKMGIRRAAFWPAAAATLALTFSIPDLIENGIINNDVISIVGTVMKKQMIHLSPAMPAIDTETFAWACFGDSTTKKVMFELLVDINESVKLADWIICNSAYELETGSIELFPKISPAGPLSAGNRLGNQAGNFWPEDAACLQWLDQQPACSVIYVAFGSFTVFDLKQFQELALGLELTNRPFLWVVRSDITDATNEGYPKGFKDRIGSRGLIVSWAPQQQVLRHPSVVCFLSHCGWNSTTEGVSNGVPFLCWPYFADQFLDQSYICDVWKIGLGFDKDESGIITQGEIKNKVEHLLGDIKFKERAMDLKEKVVNGVEGDGCSYKNFSNIIEWMK